MGDEQSPELHVEPVGGEGASIEPSGPRRRWSVIAGIGVVALVVAGIAIVGRDNGGTTAPPTVAPTTSTVAPTTAAPTTTTVPPTTAAPVAGPPQLEPGAGSVLAGTTGTLWALVRDVGAPEVVAIDLATGAVRRRRVGFSIDGDVQLFTTADPGALVFTADGVERIGPDLEVEHIGGVRPMSPLVVTPAGDVWGVPVGQPLQLVHVMLRSLSTPETIDLPGDYFFVGVDPAGTPWATSDAGTTAYDAATWTWRPVSATKARLLAGNLVVEQVCDGGSCVDQVRDVVSGVSHRLEPTHTVPGYFFAVALAPASGEAAALVDDGPSGVRMATWDAAGLLVSQQALVDLTETYPALTFTPDGAFLLYADGPNLRVVALANRTEARTFDAELRLRELLAGTLVQAVVSSAG